MRFRVCTAAVGLALALACAGCGLGPGAGSARVSIRVTEDFGARTVTTVDAGRVSGAPSDLSLLRRHLTIRTAPGGRTLAAVDGRAAGGARRWLTFVNGVRTGAAGVIGTDVHRGDDIWLDLHDTSATRSVPAVVGSFPEPFARGTGGKRYPTTLECGRGVDAACDAVAAAFSHAHIPLSKQLIGTGSGPDTLSVDVARWTELAPAVAGELVDKGPGASGVYARFGDEGHRLDLLDASGRVARRLGAGAGLIVATGDTENVPTWLVGGTDAAGVLAAARALTPQSLAGHFALAVRGASRYPVPVAAR